MTLCSHTAAALWPALSSRPVEDRRLSWPGRQLHIQTDCLSEGAVTHRSTNRARRRVTSLRQRDATTWHRPSRHTERARATPRDVVELVAGGGRRRLAALCAGRLLMTDHRRCRRRRYRPPSEQSASASARYALYPVVAARTNNRDRLDDCQHA